MVIVKVTVRVQHRFGVACIASVLVKRAFQHSGRQKVGLSESKNLLKQGVVGREEQHLSANPSILKNAHWFSQLSLFID